MSSSPTNQNIKINESNVKFTWTNYSGDNFYQTRIAMFDNEPTINTVPTEDQIIYRGTDEEFIYSNYGTLGSVWFVFYTYNTNGNYSQVEVGDKYNITPNNTTLLDKHQIITDHLNREIII